MIGRLTPRAKHTLAPTMARVNRNRRPPSVMPMRALTQTKMPPHPSGRGGGIMSLRLTAEAGGQRWRSDRGLGAVVAHASVLQQLLQLAFLEHLAHDVATADEFTLDVKLGDGRPVRKAFDPLANAHVFEHVDILVADAEVAENLRHLRG